MKFYNKDFFSNYDQIRSLLRIWSHLLKKCLTENFVFYAVIEYLNDKLWFKKTGADWQENKPEPNFFVLNICFQATGPCDILEISIRLFKKEAKSLSIYKNKKNQLKYHLLLFPLYLFKLSKCKCKR